MSDTPITDALLSDQHHDCVPYDDAAGQLAELCRKLERERDEALYDATQETIKNSTLKSHWITACQERDQWRECAEKLAYVLNGQVPWPPSMDKDREDALAE